MAYDVSPDGMTEQQVRGLSSMYAEQGVNSPFHALPVDPNAALYPRINALRMYEKMKRNDQQVRNSLKVCKYAILGGEWYVEPASDSQDDKDVAEFVAFNMFENMSYTFLECMNHLLTFMDYGFAVGEIVWDIGMWRPARPNSNSRPVTMLRKIAPRPAVTIQKFLYDAHGGPNGVIQNLVDPTGTDTSGQAGNEVTLPIEKLVVLTNDKEGGDMEGMSVLRTAYLHWYFKHRLYDIDAIQKERHGMGVPDVQLPPSFTDEDLAIGAKMAQSLRTNARGFILRPQGFEFGFAKVEGNLTNALISAEHHDMKIAQNVLVQFINVQAGESRSNTATAYDLFEKAQRQTGAYVCDMLNKYVVKSLVDKNFPVIRYPKLAVRGIGQARDLQQMASAIRNLIDVNAVTPDDEFEKFVRKTFDFPITRDKDTARVNEMLIKPFASPDGQPVTNGGNVGSATAAAKNGNPSPPSPSSGKRGPVQGNTGKGPNQNV